MMNEKATEIAFVESFVLKNKRERSIFELNSKKKRKNFFSKLCHRYNDIIDNRFMTELSAPNSNYSEIYRLLMEEGAGRDCYLISYFEELDGKRIPLAQALKNCVGGGMPSIVICDPGKLAYFEAEQQAGPPPRFLLKKK